MLKLIRPGLTVDNVGMDLADLALARIEAIMRIRAILSAEAAIGAINLNRRFEITDESGKVLLSVPFTAAID